VSTLRARCPDCRTLTAVALEGGEYECHSCGRSFSAGLVRVPRAWGQGGEAMAEAAFLQLPYPEVGVVDEETVTEQTLALAATLPERPLVLGGCCCAHVGAVEGLATRRDRLAVVWFDAHGDLNTPESSPSGNVHGMPLAAALGLAPDAFASDVWPLPAVEPERTVLLGVRSLDPGERETVQRLGIGVYTMSEVDRQGVETVLREALDRVDGAAFVHVSLDMDVIDPDVAPGVGTPVRGGLSYREAHLAMELLAESGVFDSFEIVEVNPILDRENATGRLAVELAASAFGARIL
jgi:arginase